MANKVDEPRFTKQVYALGWDAQIKLMEASVLVIGLGGLGAEIGMF